MVYNIGGGVETLMGIGTFHHVGARELRIFANFCTKNKISISSKGFINVYFCF